jgi:hypothetical protein
LVSPSNVKETKMKKTTYRPAIRGKPANSIQHANCPTTAATSRLGLAA